MSVRYLVRFETRAVPPFGDATDNCEVLLTASTDTEAKRAFSDFRCEHLMEYEGRQIVSEMRLIKEEVMVRG
ncbi:hypothetical protein GF391_04450 [Candidatus Uhrbacteria bacterium]|nr:hypothetical protein [Candidatus Uhrbacteria bacterium]